MNFTEEQLAAINAKDGVYVVIACPGAGKTFCIVERYLKLLSSGVSSKDILSLTFTNKAAEEMAKRSGIDDAKHVFRTFHSFCLDLLQKERGNLPFTLCETIIPVEGQNFELLFRLCKTYPSIPNFRRLSEAISNWKKQDIAPDQALEEASGIEYFLALAYRDYQKKSLAEGWLDFDDLQKRAIELLEANEEVRTRWRRKYIQVDEGQDSCADQLRLLQLIFDGNIFIVGDSGQLIFEWRGAKADSLTNFHRYFPGAKTLYLSTNFRSTEALVDFFREILPSDNGLATRMIANTPGGEEPEFVKYEDDYQEAEKVLDSIDDPVNTAILARTNRQLFKFQKMCATRGIKYRILTKKDLFDQNEIRRLIKLARDNEESMKHVSAQSALRTLIDQHRLMEIYKNSGDIDSDPLENLEMIYRMGAKHANLTSFLKHLKKVMHARKSAKGLTISTIHASKGLEFDNVYLIGVSQGILPHTKGELQEEMRIFFVGATRAAKKLVISFFNNPSMFILPYQERFRSQLSAASVR